MNKQNQMLPTMATKVGASKGFAGMMRICILMMMVVLADMGTAWAYHFSAVAPSGQTLYYNISGSDVTVTYPYYSNNWGNYAKPKGALTIPSTVTNNGTTYTVTRIGHDAFNDCDSLTSVVIPNSVATIESKAFKFCSNLSSISLPSTLTFIGYDAFMGCNTLNDVVLPESLIFIDYDAFCDCSSLSSIVVPSAVRTIEAGLFRNCSSLASVVLPDSLEAINSSAFINCSSLTEIEIPNMVTAIGEKAFDSCTSLTRVVIPGSLTTILPQAFANCYSLTSVVIPDGVISIEQMAFSNCYNVRKLVIGRNVNHICIRTFMGMSALDTIWVNAQNPPELMDNAFAGVGSMTTVVVPCGSLDAYYQSNEWTSYFENIIDSCGNTEAVEDVASPTAFEVFPNPMTDHTVISCEALDEDVQVILYNRLGRRIDTYTMQPGSTELTINTSSLPSGIYILHLEGRHTHAVKTVVKR